jgi:uncharacterized membrane protein YhaH (DUF805 family)
MEEGLFEGFFTYEGRISRLQYFVRTLVVLLIFSFLKVFSLPFYPWSEYHF